MSLIDLAIKLIAIGFTYFFFLYLSDGMKFTLPYI